MSIHVHVCSEHIDIHVGHEARLRPKVNSLLHSLVLESSQLFVDFTQSFTLLFLNDSSIMCVSVCVFLLECGANIP